MDIKDCLVDFECKPQTREYPYACSLELDTGNDTHITLAFLNVCPSPFAQRLIMSNILHIARKNFTQFVQVLTEDKLLKGWFNKKSKCVKGDISRLKFLIMKWLEDRGFDISRDLQGTIPHTRVISKDGEHYKRPGGTVDVYSVDSYKWSKPFNKKIENSCEYFEIEPSKKVKEYYSYVYPNSKLLELPPLYFLYSCVPKDVKELYLPIYDPEITKDYNPVPLYAT